MRSARGDISILPFASPPCLSRCLGGPRWWHVHGRGQQWVERGPHTRSSSDTSGNEESDVRRSPSNPQDRALALTSLQHRNRLTTAWKRLSVRDQAIRCRWCMISSLLQLMFVIVLMMRILSDTNDWAASPCGSSKSATAAWSSAREELVHRANRWSACRTCCR